MFRTSLLIVSLFLISYQLGCSQAYNLQADRLADNSLASFKNLLDEFKTVTDDESAREKLPDLDQLYHDFVKSVESLEEAQKKSYVTGGGAAERADEFSNKLRVLGKQFGAHRDSLPESTTEILSPFFEKLKNGPIR